jgi:hypothetical protein
MVTWMHAANWDASILLRNRPLSITQMYPKPASIIVARQYSPHQLATTCPFAPKKTATTLIIFQRENYHCRSPSSLRDVQRSPVERPGIPHWDSGRYTATLALRPPVPRLVVLNECPQHKEQQNHAFDAEYRCLRVRGHNTCSSTFGTSQQSGDTDCPPQMVHQITCLHRRRNCGFNVLGFYASCIYFCDGSFLVHSEVAGFLFIS